MQSAAVLQSCITVFKSSRAFMHTRCAVSTDGLHGSSVYLLGRITTPINFLPDAVQCAKALHQRRVAVMEE